MNSRAAESGRESYNLSDFEGSTNKSRDISIQGSQAKMNLKRRKNLSQQNLVPEDVVHISDGHIFGDEQDIKEEEDE